jgi:hypothetical protein
VVFRSVFFLAEKYANFLRFIFCGMQNRLVRGGFDLGVVQEFMQE